MALKTIDQNPKITDTIRFLIETPDLNDCLSSNPYKVESIKIFYIERDFLGNNYGTYEKTNIDEKLQSKLQTAREIVCINPNEDNILEVTRLQNEILSKSKSDTFYYKDAVLVEEVGTPDNPAWLSTDIDHALISQITEDIEGNPLYGTFLYDWNPKSKVREGDFFICWTWAPLLAGDSLSAHQQFSLWGDGKAVQTLPTHHTPDNKYYTLLELYLPEMYKTSLTDNDLTPQITDKLNQAIADGFTYTENFANQIIDLYDANVLHESLLVYLSNLFNLKLKSDDPTLWRRQIKTAIPLFKKKGTLEGLQEAFAQSGMTLDKYTTLWQVTSPFTWIQSYVVDESPTFKLEKTPILGDDTNFALWIRRENSDTYDSISLDNIEFEEVDCEYFITWVGDERSSNPIPLYQGDILKIQYQYGKIQSGDQDIENYIQSLDIADERDERLFTYPLKNWNVKVIEEDDPLFDVIVPVRHPFKDYLIFGQVRTEFPYSENIYNMEEYNGSTRDSYDVCFIDKTFRDPCGSCVSSKYNIDIGIGNLTNERLVEVYDILNEYTPFTSVPHRINFRGDFIDFVNPPVEEIDFLVQFNLVEYVISGGANPFFHRVMKDGLTNWVIDREDLSAQTVKASGRTGTAYNNEISIITPNVNLSNLGLIVDNHILEIIAPSPNSGIYTLDNVKGETANVATNVMEPLNTEGFTFKLSNIIFESLNARITQEVCSTLIDNDISLFEYGIKTDWDIENTPDYTGGAWKINIPSLNVTLNISKTEGSQIYLPCDVTIPAGSYSYRLLNDNNEEILVSNCLITNFYRGRVNIVGSNAVNIVRHGDYLLYDNVEYLVDELKLNGDLTINDYSDGNAVGVSVKFLRRLVYSDVGYFVYNGLKLLTSTNHETEFNIQNGLGSPVTDPDQVLDNSNFKENFLIQINSDYYKVSQINGTEITLEGLPQDWGTILSGGTLVNYSVHQFVNDTIETNFVVFDQIDRREKDVIIREIESTVTNDVAIVALSLKPEGGQGIEETILQEEGVSFEIKYLNGSTQEGEI